VLEVPGVVGNEQEGASRRDGRCGVAEDRAPLAGSS
jgi:hypothetical protein